MVAATAKGIFAVFLLAEAANSSLGLSTSAAIALASTTAAPLQASSGLFNLRVVHTNDVHSRYEETDAVGNPCSVGSAKTGRCYGGVARRYTKIQQLRAGSGVGGGGPNATLLLDAGDQFQGTLWFVVHGANITAHFMKLLNYDAMAIGNHDFDLGVAGLARLVDGVSDTFPVLSCNMNVSREPSLAGVRPYVVMTRGGRRIGVVGYTLADLPSVTSAGNYGSITLNDEVSSIRKAAEELINQSVDIIIALGHSGYDVDQRIAAEVEEVDVVVGGHSHTLLYNGSSPTGSVSSGPYPTVVSKRSGSGRRALVVQAFHSGIYLGRLDVSFNSTGDIVSWSGMPELLDSQVPQDSAVLQDVARWGTAVEAKGSEEVGNAKSFLNGSIAACGLRECDLGSLITDAFTMAKGSDGRKRSSLAVFNAISIGTSISSGTIRYRDILGAIPYQNTIDFVALTGSDIREMFEYSVSDYGENRGAFLQVSGFKVTYNVSKPAMSRVIALDVFCANCSKAEYAPLNHSHVYTVLISSYMAAGGGGYSIVRDKKLSHEIGPLDADLLIEYVQKFSPLSPPANGRIIFQSKPTGGGQPSAAAAAQPSWYLLFAFAALLQL